MTYFYHRLKIVTELEFRNRFHLDSRGQLFRLFFLSVLNTKKNPRDMLLLKGNCKLGFPL